MYIGSIMRTDLITVAPKTTLVEAKELLEKHRIDHLLVVKNGKLASALFVLELSIFLMVSMSLTTSPKTVYDPSR